jgi:B12-binding domain/radical SAM domain protein
MNATTAFIVYYSKENKYSFNALIGALETTSQLDHIEVRIYDPPKKKTIVDSSLFLMIDDCISKFEHVVLGISFFTTQVWDVYPLIRNIRKKYCNQIILVAGGPHPSGEPKSTLDFGFNHVFIGESEDTINEFFYALQNGMAIETIPGIYSKSNDGEYSYTQRDKTVELDKYLPISDYHKRFFGPIEITRGCPFACSFCQTTHLFGTVVRHRSLSSIETVLSIMQKYGRRDFRAITPNALAYGSSDGKKVDLDAVRALLSTIKRGLPDGRIFLGSFPSEVRPEHVTEESLKLLCEFVSNDNIIIGAQTGSQRLLDSCHRGHSIYDIYVAVELSVRFGLTPNVDFMFGLPGETSDDVYDSIIVMNDLIEKGARIHAHTFMPLPQTPFAKSGRGRINDEIRMYIRKHVSQGVVYGDWAEQARQSQKIGRFLRTKQIDDNDCE